MAVSANAQPLLRSSLTTNNTSTNMFWDDTAKTLSFRNLAGVDATTGRGVFGITTPPSSGRLGLYGTGVDSALVIGTGSPDSASVIRLWYAGGAGYLTFGGSGSGGHFYIGHNNTGGNTNLFDFNEDGSISISGKTNKISLSSTNTLLLDGQPLVTGGTTVTNNVINSTTINVTSNNFTVGKGGHLTITNNILFPYTTLTFSGTNVSQMNLTNTAFVLTLTTNAFIGTPTGFPGTGLMGTYMIHVKQDAAGLLTLTLTNGSFIVNGSGTSTNAVLGILTNANAYSLVTLTSSPFEASKVMAVVTTLGP